MACVWTDNNGRVRVEQSHWSNGDWDCIGGCGRVLQPTKSEGWAVVEDKGLMCPDCQARCDEPSLETEPRK